MIKDQSTLKINRDNKGFIFSLDAVLALIPVFIVLMAVSGVDQGSLVLPSQQIRLSNQAQDTMDAMAQYPSIDKSLIEEMVTVLKVNNNDADTAKEVVHEFLNRTLPGRNYKLVELNQLNGDTIISKGNMDDAQNVAVGSRSYGNYSFRLYVWDSN